MIILKAKQPAWGIRIANHKGYWFLDVDWGPYLCVFKLGRFDGNKSV